MKLATFEKDGHSGWGIVVAHPRDGRLWIYEPGKVERQLKLSATATNGFSVSMPSFLGWENWPKSLREFLSLEDAGMEALRRLERFLLRFLSQADDARMTYAGHPLDEVTLRAPIPDPRLMWGLVQNSPSFIRANPARHSTNLFPQGHQRPATSVIGTGQIFYHPASAGKLAYNVELGVVIGKKGRYIPVNRALDHVAGLTVVIDSAADGYETILDRDKVGHYEIASQYDWYVGATCSWGGKMSDANCTVGPCVTTLDEVGNLYDLLVYTRMNGRLRDRAHTAGFLLGVERVIQWYSSFATLYPGDIIHMGTLGTDGVGLPPDCPFNGPDATIEAEIETVGEVKCPVLCPELGDWRAKDDPTRLHISPVVRDIMREGKDEIARPQDWSPAAARSFWTLYKNYRRVTEDEGIRQLPLPTPRFLDNPASALGRTGSVVELPPRCRDLTVSIEMALVVKKVCGKVKAREADRFVLGYLPMVALTDSSFGDILVEPTTKQEKGLPLVYGRWADGFNVVGAKVTPLKWSEAADLRMTLKANGRTVAGSTSEYVATAKDALQFVSTYITLMPGDVMTLGCVHAQIRIPKDEIKDGMSIEGSIERLGKVSFTLKHSEAADTSVAYNALKL